MTNMVIGRVLTIDELFEMGYKAVETMVQVLDGETVDEFVDSGSDVVTPDNAQERLDTLKTQLH